MIDLEKKMGPLRLRAWGLVLNMMANAIALLGLAKVLSGDSGSGGWLLLIIGVVLTLLCIFVCAIPVRDKE